MNELILYTTLLQEIKQRIGEAQTLAMLSVNAELIRLYWDIGRLIDQRQQAEGWGTGFIPKLSTDLRNELPEVKGFSKRNIGYMVQFAREYGDPASVQQTDPGPSVDTVGWIEMDDLSILQQLVAKIPWGHNILLLERVKDLAVRQWYMQQTIVQGWSRNTLSTMINSRLHERQGQATSNCATHLPAPQSDLVQQALKDPLVFLNVNYPRHLCRGLNLTTDRNSHR